MHIVIKLITVMGEHVYVKLYRMYTMNQIKILNYLVIVKQDSYLSSKHVSTNNISGNIYFGGINKCTSCFTFLDLPYISNIQSILTSYLQKSIINEIIRPSGRASSQIYIPANGICCNFKLVSSVSCTSIRCRNFYWTSFKKIASISLIGIHYNGWTVHNDYTSSFHLPIFFMSPCAPT